MPGIISSVQRFDRTTGIPNDVSDVLHANAARVNLIIPHLEKVFGIQEFSPGIAADSEQFWLVYKPKASPIKFVLSCTEGPMGKYPIFIVATVPILELTPELLEESMNAFCQTLLNDSAFRKERVFSVFSVDVVAEAFAEAWSTHAEIAPIAEPYYDAIFSTCTSDTLVRDAPPPLEDLAIELRLAVEGDAPKIATLCYEFAATSPPFTLTDIKASQEAHIMITNKQVWVFEIQKPNGESDIASIVAVTRKSASNDVAAITKVYTPEMWRGKRCAERLVRRVCRELLKTYKQVVLYVGVDNSARRVYDRVGFQGLAATEGEERWREIGFDQDKVELGHW